MNQNMRQFYGKISFGLAVSSLVIFVLVVGCFILKLTTLASVLWSVALAACGISVGTLFGVLAKRVSRTNDRLSVFISYAMKDAKAAAKLADNLRVHGIQPLLPSELVKPGDLVAEVVKEAIFNSDAVVLLLSDDTQSQGFQLEDIKESVVRNRPIFPVLLKNQPIPESLREVQPINLADSWDRGVEDLIQAIEKHGKHFVSQSEMNRFAADSAHTAKDELSSVVEQLEKLLDPERVALMHKSQKAWEEYARAQADFSSSEALGGSMRPLLYHSEFESLTRERIARLRQELSQQEL